MNDPRWDKAIREYREELDRRDQRRAQMFVGFVIWAIIMGGVVLVGFIVSLLVKLVAG